MYVILLIKHVSPNIDINRLPFCWNIVHRCIICTGFPRRKKIRDRSESSWVYVIHNYLTTAHAVPLFRVALCKGINSCSKIKYRFNPCPANCSRMSSAYRIWLLKRPVYLRIACINDSEIIVWSECHAA